jgi:hypothetical protein
MTVQLIAQKVMNAHFGAGFPDDELLALAKGYVDLLAAPTPDRITKAAYIGEFKISRTIMDSDGNDQDEQITVPWTTVKEIMAAIRMHGALES